MAVDTALDPDMFRTLLRRQAATVTVVTVPGAGFTATSFTSVSLRPPLVAFALDHGASAWPAVSTAEHVAVHLLGEGQQEVARTFATSGIDRFATHTAWRPGPYGVPVLDGALAVLVCRIRERVPAGDHSIVLATPVIAETSPTGRPLVYHEGRYGAVAS